MEQELLRANERLRDANLDIEQDQMFSTGLARGNLEARMARKETTFIHDPVHRSQRQVICTEALPIPRKMSLLDAHPPGSMLMVRLMKTDGGDGGD